MLKNTYQSGIISLFCSSGTKPLQIWDTKKSDDGILEIKNEDELTTPYLEIIGENIAENYILCPAWSTKTLGITLPYFCMIVKPFDKFFSFEIQTKDDQGLIRRFRICNYQSLTRVREEICTLPLKLDTIWNHVQIDLADITRKTYGTQYQETLRIQINANCQLKRIWYCDKYVCEEDLPKDFRIYSKKKL
ncbi:hypothetical protein WA158_000682 [Blastocystis sp. Blastoise]